MAWPMVLAACDMNCLKASLVFSGEYGVMTGLSPRLVSPFSSKVIPAMARAGRMLVLTRENIDTPAMTQRLSDLAP